MTPKSSHEAGTSPPRAYLVTPPVEDDEAFVRVLASVLAADADIAAVLLRLAPADERTLIKRVKALAPIIQEKGIALVLDGHPEIVARSGADGAHLHGIDAFKQALVSLKPGRIAGVGGLHARHDAMLAAEAGADYVMFGEPGDGARRRPFVAIADRIAWWAEIFEIPCVGYAASADEVVPIVAAGADFVAFGEFVFSDPQGLRAALSAAARGLRAERAG